MNSPYILDEEVYQIEQKNSYLQHEGNPNLSQTVSFLNKADLDLPKYPYLNKKRQGKDLLERSFSVSPSQDKNATIVSNICNQIKYLIQGNLRNDDLTINMVEIVRDNIIPMLIKMFFQKTNLQRSFYEDKTMSSTMDSKQGFKQITNSFKHKDNRHHRSSNEFKQKLSSLFAQTSKSAFCQNNTKGQKQNYHDFQAKEFDTTVSQKQIIPKMLYLTILLLKINIVKKSFCLEKIKTFGKFKQNSLKAMGSLVKKHDFRIFVEKLRQISSQVQQNKVEAQLLSQKYMFKLKSQALSCQIMAKILRIKFKSYFQLFKQNSTSQNKWMKQWIQNAALRSPMTVKTSIWRLKNFLIKSQQEQTNEQIQRALVQNISQKSIKLQNISPCQAQVSLPYQVAKFFSKNSLSSSQQSISSNQFQQMFQDQQGGQQQYKIDARQRYQSNNQQNVVEGQRKNFQKKDTNFEHSMEIDNFNQTEEDYLNTISEEETQQESACE